MSQNIYVYILANTYNTVLYIGVTNDLERRLWEHKNHAFPNSFTAKYKCDRLVYFEHTNDIRAAISREKQLKNWKRAWKNELIEKQNPEWADLSNKCVFRGDCGSQAAMTVSFYARGFAPTVLAHKL